MAASANEPAMKSLKSSTKGPIPNFSVSLSSTFTQTPFVRTSKPNLLPLPPSLDSVKLIQDLHRSLVSVTEIFDGFFHLLASRNPLFQEFVRLPSKFRVLCDEVRFRNITRVRFAMSNHGFAAVLPGDSVAGLVVANRLINFLNIYNTILVSPLSTLCDPYLNIFQGFIPPLGGLDLSPILAFFVRNTFTSTAMALSCELLPTKGAASSETKWMRRRRLSSHKDRAQLL